MTERKMRWEYTTPAEMLAAFQFHNTAMGRPVCPVCDYIAAHLDDDIADVEAHLYTDPDLAPGLIADGLYATANWDVYPRGTLADAEADQDALVAALADVPYVSARTELEGLLRRFGMRFLTRAAIEGVLAYIRAGHPNPKAFLMQPDILAIVPADIDLTDYPCPDFPELADVEVQGADE